MNGWGFSRCQWEGECEDCPWWVTCPEMADNTMPNDHDWEMASAERWISQVVSETEGEYYG